MKKQTKRQEELAHMKAVDTFAEHAKIAREGVVRYTLRMTKEQHETITARAREWQTAGPGSRSLNDWILTQLLRPTLHHLDG